MPAPSVQARDQGLHGRRIGDLAEVDSRLLKVDGHGITEPVSAFDLFVALIQLDQALRVYKDRSIGAEVIGYDALKVVHYVPGK